MLVARVLPPLPDREVPPQVSFQRPLAQRVSEIVTRPGGLLVRRLAADLADLGYEVAWVRPLPFELDPSSLGALLLMALAAARQSSSAGQELIIVVESATAAQAESILGQLLLSDASGFAPSVVLITDNRCRTYGLVADKSTLEVSPWLPHLLHGLLPDEDERTIPLQELLVAAGGLANVIEGAVRIMPKVGAAEFARILAKTGNPAALTRAVASCVLSGASAERLAALEMAAHLGYAHARFRSLEPGVAETAGDPWWIPLTAGWLQVSLAWREAIVAGAGQSTVAARSACLSRLVADLIDEGAVHEAIELCINTRWHGFAVDLLAEEAERLVSSGWNATLVRWLGRIPTEVTRGYSGLATLAGDLQLAQQQEDAQTRTSQGTPLAPVWPPSPRPRWPFRGSRHNPDNDSMPPPKAVLADVATALSNPHVANTEVAPPTGRDTRDTWGPAAGSYPPAGDAIQPGGAESVAAQAATRQRGTVPTAAAAVEISQKLSTGRWQHDRETTDRVQVKARLLGPFELDLDHQQVEQWRGKQGRMLLAYLLLHRSRPVHADTLGGIFWPEAAPDVVRNRLHVALYGLRRDLRAVCPHPVVVHGQGGFSFHKNVDLWLDAEVYLAKLSAARRQEVSEKEIALAHYDEALELYRGDLLEDAPFEDWALLDREQLRLEHLETLDRIAQICFELGQYEGCVPVCQRLANGEVCREEVHRMLMRCYARLNKPHLAIHQYRLCERQLRDELALKPAEATRKLYEQICRRQIV
jgi:SARP family transcriptional regulator, regulator of embCAB operon